MLAELCQEEQTLSTANEVSTVYNEARSKLDYFLLGATLAICGYLAQTNAYGRLGVNKETFLLMTLLVFAASAVAGYKGIEANVSIIRKNAEALLERDPTLRAAIIHILREDRTAHRYYILKNYLLLVGFLCYLATKVWSAYQGNGWTSVH